LGEWRRFCISLIFSGLATAGGILIAPILWSAIPLLLLVGGVSLWQTIRAWNLAVITLREDDSESHGWQEGVLVFVIVWSLVLLLGMGMGFAATLLGSQ